MPFQCARGAWSKNEEPSVDELLSEPVIRALMKKDGVNAAAVRQVIDELRERRARSSDQIATSPRAPGLR